MGHAKITERDIFNFVFSKQKLSKSKLDEISGNAYFIDKVRFYEKMKENLSQELDSEAKSKIASSIPNYKTSKPKLLHHLIQFSN